MRIQQLKKEKENQMLRKIMGFITIILLVALSGFENVTRSAPADEIQTTDLIAEPQYGSQESEQSEKSEKQARKEGKKGRKKAKGELPSGRLPVPAGVEEIPGARNAPALRFADARLTTGVRLRYAESGDP